MVNSAFGTGQASVTAHELAADAHPGYLTLVAIHTTKLPATGSNNLGINIGCCALAGSAARFMLCSRLGVAY